jgi:peptide/nickel transport system ATP-binding protein
MRIQVRTDRGDGPVLVDDVSFAEARRGDRPDRRIRRRQIDDRARLDGLHARRLLHRRRPDPVSNGKDVRTMSADERRALRGPRIAYIAQSAAASFNPAMTLMDQVCEAAVRPRRADRPRRASRGDQPVPQA